MYRASDEVDNADWLETLEQAADRLDLGTDARSHAREVFLSTVPESERSKQAKLASSLYVGALIAGDQRSQTKVADAVGVSRLSVQQHWKEQLKETGLQPPGW
ncbi:transcription initiation factor IIB family protein [Halobacteriaceae bacterium SHR40]|uniref:transcription initiation factor IIB family protein n=1 Tax=Halovenus amylolytica TaxID=2500550 RepID=UPI000FE2F031